MRNERQVIIDSDAFVGLFWEKDELHQSARIIFEELKRNRIQLTTTSAVVTETATVLSHRKGQDLARLFLNDFIEANNFPVIWIDEQLHTQGLQLFKEQTIKGTSFTDCVNVAVCHQLQMPWIFSFDQVYVKKFGLHLTNSAFTPTETT